MNKPKKIYQKTCSSDNCSNVTTYTQRSSMVTAYKMQSRCRPCRTVKTIEHKTGLKYTDVTRKRMSAAHQKRLYDIEVVNVPDYVPTPTSAQAHLKEWSRLVREKYKCRCDSCGVTAEDKGRALDAHHILPHALFPESKLDVDNGILLCRSCHKLLHAELERRVEIMAKPRLLESDEFKSITADWLIR